MFTLIVHTGLLTIICIAALYITCIAALYITASEPKTVSLSSPVSLVLAPTPQPSRKLRGYIKSTDMIVVHVAIYYILA